MGSDLDFATGKLIDVARAQRPQRRAEYLLLAIVVLTTSIPYALAVVYFPWPTMLFMGFVLVFKVVAAFFVSSQSGVSHHIRFLLAGSNPFGMAAASSTLFGAVDLIIDWHEDASARERKKWPYWTMAIIKFLVTPLGVLFILLEFSWDLVLLRRTVAIVNYKWQELFSLAYYHDLICPEKSNDLCYADLAFARYQESAFMYQWNRMRALVFELKHYALDVEQGIGDAESNLFYAGDLAAYQILKRLEIESIEQSLQRHFEEQPESFPMPQRIAERLIKNARPINHYLQFREKFTNTEREASLGIAPDQQLHELLARVIDTGSPSPMHEASYVTWHVLRLLDEPSSLFSPGFCRYLTAKELARLQRAQILKAIDGKQELPSYAFTREFLSEFERWLQQSFTAVSKEQANALLLHKLPNLLTYHGVSYQWRL